MYGARFSAIIGTSELNYESFSSLNSTELSIQFLVKFRILRGSRRYKELR